MLDERKAAILSAVVREYIETAQPVGSGRVASAPGIDVSPATVRNELAALEEAGYLIQPHTSAGRIPTDRGYRFFVDALRDSQTELATADPSTLRDFFAGTHGQLESMMQRTSDMLTSLTDWTAVVVGPSIDQATIRSVQIVDLASHIAMVVAVLSNGVIEKRTVEVATELTPEIVEDASRRLVQAVEGKTLAELEQAAPDDRPDPLLDAAIAALSAAVVTPSSMSVGPRVSPAPLTPPLNCRRSLPCSRSRSWSCRWCATSSIAACGLRSATKPAWSRSPIVPWSSHHSRSMAYRLARLASWARPVWIIRRRCPQWRS